MILVLYLGDEILHPGCCFILVQMGFLLRGILSSQIEEPQKKQQQELVHLYRVTCLVYYQHNIILLYYYTIILLNY